MSNRQRIGVQKKKRESCRKGVFLRVWACSACSASLAGSRLGLCQHGRRRRQSDECGSAKHGRQRYLCKDCGGKGICRCHHERRRSVCKECGGGSGAASTVGAAASARKAVEVAFTSTGGGAMIAGSAAAADLRARATPYGLQRMRRRQPRAAGCEHGRQHSVCKECGGNGICEHGQVRSACKECGGGRSAGTAWVVWCAAGLVKKYLTSIPLKTT